MIKAEEIPEFLIGYNGESHVKNNEDLEKYIELCERVGEDLIRELFQLADYTQGFEYFLKDCEERLIFYRNYFAESRDDSKYKYKEMLEFITNLLGIKDEFSIFKKDWDDIKESLEKLDIALIGLDSGFQMLFYYGPLEFDGSHFDEMEKMQTVSWRALSWRCEKNAAKEKFDRKYHVFKTLKSRCIVKYVDLDGECGNFKVSMRKIFNM